MPDSYDYSQPSNRNANTAAQIPLITYLLCGLCIIITAAYLTSDQMPGTLWYTIGHFGAPDMETVWDGKYFPLFMSVFVHANILHILFNLFWLRQLGTILESTLNPVVYLLFFAAAAIIGSGAEIACTGQTGIGASGVVYAMFGLMWAGRGRFPEWRAVATAYNLRIFILWGIFCLFTTLVHYMPVANAAHAGGFLFGLAVGWLFFAPRRRLIWSIPLAALIAVTVLSVTWMPWSGDWDFWKGNKEFKRRHYHNAIGWYYRSLSHGYFPNGNWDNISRAWDNIGSDEAERGNMDAALKALSEATIANQKAGHYADTDLH